MDNPKSVIFEALDELQVELSPSERARINEFLTNNPRVSAMAQSAIANTLRFIAGTPAGVGTLLHKDFREFLVPAYGQQFLQQLNADEALLMNDVTNAIQRHMREAGMVSYETPVSGNNPRKEGPRTLLDPAPADMGFDYNRRPQGGTASVIARTVGPEDADAEHDEHLEQIATQPAIPPATGDEVHDDSARAMAI
jgi:hypothetical protein